MLSLNDKLDNIIFDVDGTLTPALNIIDSGFMLYLTNFIIDNPYNFYIVSGSDYPKSKHQIGTTLCHLMDACFNCSGNSVWRKGVEIYTNHYSFPENLIKEILPNFLKISKYSEILKDNIELRTGVLNFSVVGRSANLDQREQYYLWDVQNREREQICSYIENEFPQLSATIGGKISIDIYPKGKDKSQILDWIRRDGRVIFIGDKTKKGGNDFTLANRIRQEKRGQVYQVTDYKHTKRILEKELNVN